MEIRITTKQILNVLHVIAWIIFILALVDAGGILFNTLYTLFINSSAANSNWNRVDLSALYKTDQTQYVTVTVKMIIVAVLKAILFYLIIKMFANKSLSIDKPFTKYGQQFIANAAYVCLGISLFAGWGAKSAAALVANSIAMPTLDKINFGGADVWFFMAIVLFVIAMIFRRGIELQTENDLTV